MIRPLVKMQQGNQLEKKEVTDYARLPFDCFSYILEFVGNNIQIRSKISMDELLDDSFINWKQFIKYWFGRFNSDGRIRFLFKYGMIHECKKNSNFAQIKFLLFQMKKLQSPNIPYWESQLIGQITRISEKKLTTQHRYEVDKYLKDKSYRTSEKKVEQFYLDSFCKRIESFSKKKENQLLFNIIKSVNFEDVPRNLELLNPVLSLFPNFEQLKLVDIFAFGLERVQFSANFNNCKILELKTKYENDITFKNLTYFPNLEVFSCYGELTIQNTLLLKELKSLRVLMVKRYYYNHISPNMIEICSILSEFPKLEILTIDTNLSTIESLCELSKSKTIQHLKITTEICPPINSFPLGGFSALSSLTLTEGYLAFSHFLELPKLESLQLSIPTYHDTWGDLGQLTQLKNLTCNQVKFESLLAPFLYDELMELKQLESLTIVFEIEQEENEYNKEVVSTFTNFVANNLKCCTSLRFITKNICQQFNPQKLFFDVSILNV